MVITSSRKNYFVKTSLLYMHYVKWLRVGDVPRWGQGQVNPGHQFMSVRTREIMSSCCIGAVRQAAYKLTPMVYNLLVNSSSLLLSCRQRALSTTMYFSPLVRRSRHKGNDVAQLVERRVLALRMLVRIEPSWVYITLRIMECNVHLAAQQYVCVLRW